jgi:hypothetical protein
LGLREKIRNSLQKDEKQGKPGTWHSKAYHRFFEGYSEIIVPRSNGKGSSIQRVYTRNYYQQNLTGAQRLLIRLLYAAVFLCIAYLFGSSATLPLAINTTWYVVLTQVVSLPFICWIVISLFSYLPAGRDLTIYEYRSSSLSLKKATLSAAISLGLVAVSTLIFILLNPSIGVLAELLSALKYLVGGVLALIMNRIESKINYSIIPSKNSPPVEAMEIN